MPNQQFPMMSAFSPSGQRWRRQLPAELGISRGPAAVPWKTLHRLRWSAIENQVPTCPRDRVKSNFSRSRRSALNQGEREPTRSRPFAVRRPVVHDNSLSRSSATPSIHSGHRGTAKTVAAGLQVDSGQPEGPVHD